MKYEIVGGPFRHGTQLVTPIGRIAPGLDGLYEISDEQREHLALAYDSIELAPRETPVERERTLDEQRGDAVAQATIQANREAAQQHAGDVQSIPVPKSTRRKR